jgi:hypothetical protein
MREMPTNVDVVIMTLRRSSALILIGYVSSFQSYIMEWNNSHIFLILIFLFLLYCSYCCQAKQVIKLVVVLIYNAWTRDQERIQQKKSLILQEFQANGVLKNTLL